MSDYSSTNRSEVVAASESGLRRAYLAVLLTGHAPAFCRRLPIGSGKLRQQGSYSFVTYPKLIGKRGVMIGHFRLQRR